MCLSDTTLTLLAPCCFARRYELCSYYGLYVIDEANIETHGFDPGFQHDAAHPAHSEAWLAAMMSRATRMHARDKIQPCIIMWSLGNEAGYGAAHDAMAAWLRRADPSRPVHYEVSHAAAALRSVRALSCW
jgi:beta-galactosidase